MGNEVGTPYKILGVSENIEPNELRRAYRTIIHQNKQGKFWASDFRLKVRAYETLSDFDKRDLYDTTKKWISELPIDQYTPQQLASELKLYSELVKRLKKTTLSEINRQDPITGHTALYCAARAGNLEAVRFLTQNGAEPDLSQRTKSTALHAASFYGHADVVRCLLENGADYRITNSYNNTAEAEAYTDEVRRVFAELKQEPYVRAAANDIEWFAENSVQNYVNEQYYHQRQTLLHCASKKGYFELVRLLVERLSAVQNIVDVNLNSALHLAAYGGHADIVDYFLQRGCDSTLRNRWGTTAEEEGARHGHRISILFERMRARDMFEMARQGVEWWFHYYFGSTTPDSADSKGVSLLYYACRYGHYSVARWLLEQGADVNIQMQGRPRSTPLHGAKYFGHPSIVKLLLEYNADVTIKNEFQVTALEESIPSQVDQETANEIEQILLKHRGKLTNPELLDIHIFEDGKDNCEPIKISLTREPHEVIKSFSSVEMRV